MNSELALQWYPGHMARAMRRLRDDLRACNLVVEVRDARIPQSGANAALGRAIGARRRLIVLARAQLADPVATGAWLAHLRADGTAALALDAKTPAGKALLRAALASLVGRRRSARALVVGVPNAGKSTAINALVGRRVARVEDRAGVTRGAQWFKLGGALELLDTAGILAPKLEEPQARWKLAAVGAVPRARYDAEDVVAHLLAWSEGRRGLPSLESFAQLRGHLRRGTLPDVHAAAATYLRAWNEGRFGAMTLDDPP
ncbi:MAG: YlqF/YawG family GTPase [Vulcanimicrobiaceae bacterium]